MAESVFTISEKYICHSLLDHNSYHFHIQNTLILSPKTITISTFYNLSSKVMCPKFRYFIISTKLKSGRDSLSEVPLVK